jgi:hypothetical protein
MKRSAFGTLALLALINVAIPCPNLAQGSKSKAAKNTQLTDKGGKDVHGVVPLTDPVARKLLQIEDELDAATKARVSPEATVERDLAPDWYCIGPHGDMIDRARMIAIIKTNSDRIERTESFVVIVRVYGTVAVVTGGTREIGTRNDGRAYVEPYRWTDVFHRRAGRWQIVVSESTLLPMPPQPKP